jgi:outer membrane lipoprotein carrier protein
MRQLKKIGVTIAALFITVNVYAQSPASDLTDLLLNIKTMQADFSQNIQDKSANSIQNSSGQMALERPGKFRWDVQKPQKQLIIANGVRLWIYDPDLEQVTIQSVRGGSGKTPALLLSDKSLTIDKDYDVKVIPALSAIAGLQIFQLTPKDPDDPLNKIKLTFRMKRIQEMQLQDHLGHTTVIRFQNVQTGMALDDKLFKFNPPPNIDVIDESKDPK